MRRGGDEAVSARREGHAESFRAATHGLDGAAIGADAEIRRAECHGFRQMRSGDVAAVPSASEVEPVVHAPGRRIDAALQIAGAKTGEEFFPHIRFVIPITVFEKNNVRRAGDDDAAVSGRDAITWRQPVSPDHGLVHHAIAIRVTQQFHRAVSLGLGLFPGLLTGLNAPHLHVQFAGLVQFIEIVLPLDIVTVQLAHKQPAALVPAHAGRLGDQRLTGEKFDLHSCGNLEGFRAFGGRQRPGGIVRT